MYKDIMGREFQIGDIVACERHGGEPGLAVGRIVKVCPKKLCIMGLVNCGKYEHYVLHRDAVIVGESYDKK